MKRLVRGTSRALFMVGVGFLALGLVCVALSLYVGTWPIRRLAGRSPVSARLGAAQELLAALAGAAAAFRSREP